MRILLLCHSFNSLTQRLFVELREKGEEVSVEYDISDDILRETVDLYRPELILAPFLKRAIPPDVLRKTLCLIVHPGAPGDRGPSALDWAILEGREEWGVTLLEAVEELDAGAVWASRAFPMRAATKSSLYRNEVTRGAVECVFEALDILRANSFTPCGRRWLAEGETDEGAPAARDEPLIRRFAPPSPTRGEGIAPALAPIKPFCSRAAREIDFAQDDTATVLCKIHSADGSPGALVHIAERALLCFDAREAHGLKRGAPGQILARSGNAVAMATRDGAVWIGHMREIPAGSLKLPASLVLAMETAALPEWRSALGSESQEWSSWPGLSRPSTPLQSADDAKFQRARISTCDGARPHGVDGRDKPGHDGREREFIKLSSASGVGYEQAGDIGYFRFEFYNGAMSVADCRALQTAIEAAREHKARALVLTGGPDYWSNGLHLGLIEAAESPAEESWRNINAMNDCVRALLDIDDRLVVSCIRGNAGAGGVFLALAADVVLMRRGVVLNPHYKDMGNLYGSEYWTYLLPRRVGQESARRITQGRLPMGADEALRLKLIDAILPESPADADAAMRAKIESLVAAPDFSRRIEAKHEQRVLDEARKPLEAYRQEELEKMRRNFWGFDPSYHVARHNFIRKVVKSRTPLHLAIHRSLSAGRAQ